MNNEYLEYLKYLESRIKYLQSVHDETLDAEDKKMISDEIDRLIEKIQELFW